LTRQTRAATPSSAPRHGIRAAFTAGKRWRRTVYGKTKAEVQEKLRLLQQQADRGHLLDGQSVTVAAYLGQWLRAVQGSVSHSTYLYYEGHVRLHIDPRVGGTKLKALTAPAVQAFYARMAADGVSAALRNKVGVTLGVALGEAVRLRLIHANPARDVSKPRAERKEMTALTPDQFRAFLAAAEGDRLTLNIYAHVAPGAQARAAARLDGILRPPGGGQMSG
jgi:integrase